MMKPLLPSLVYSALISAALTAFSGCIQDGGDKEPAVEEKLPLLPDAGRDTSVTFGDSVVLRGRALPGSAPVLGWEWSVGNTGSFIASANGDTAMRVGADPGVIEVVLRAIGEGGKADLDTMRITVSRDAPLANAGKDTTVSISDTVRLRGRALDRLGKIVSWEWDAGGTGRFRTSPAGDTDIVVGNRFGFQYNILRVTDDDGNIAVDTMRVTIIDDFPVAKLRLEDGYDSGTERVRLDIAAEDAGRIVAWEWDLGSGTFGAGKSDTSFSPSRADGDTAMFRIRITDDDGHTGTDSLPFLVSHWRSEGPVPGFAEAERAGEYTRMQVYNAVDWNGKYYVNGFTKTANQYYDGPLPPKFRYTRQAASFDPETRIWSKEAPLPASMVGNSLVNAGGILFSVGGRPEDSLNGNGRVYEYIPAFKDWFRRRDMPSGLRAGTSAVWQGDVYHVGFLGGTPDSKITSPPDLARVLSVQKYDAQADAWRPVSGYDLPMTGLAWNILSVAPNGAEIDVCVQNGMSKPLIVRFFPGANVWKEGWALPGLMEHAAMSELDGKVYILGGWLHWPSEDRRMLYVLDPSYEDITDPASKVWRRATSPRHNHYSASPVAINGTLLDMAEDYTLETYTP